MNYQRNPLAQRTCRVPVRQGMPCSEHAERAPAPSFGPPCQNPTPHDCPTPHPCQCKECVSGKSLAMVYAACQTFDELYSPEQGLCRGTLFAELDKPFLAGGM